MNSEGDSLTKLTWPDLYPENCPPAEAEPVSGTFYRLVRHNPARAEDFKSVFEENPKRFNYIPTIENCGLSVQKDPQDSERLERLKKRARKYKNRQIAEGNLNPTLGMIQHTPSKKYKSHHTWWVPVEAKPWTVFNIMSR